MIKVHREALQLIRSLGFTVLSSGKGKHPYWWLRSPAGHTFKYTIPNSRSDPRMRKNMEAQLRKYLEAKPHESR